MIDLSFIFFKNEYITRSLLSSVGRAYDCSCSILHKSYGHRFNSGSNELFLKNR